MSRLFFALWPDDNIRQELGRLSQAIQAAGLKSVNPQNLHVTLVFIGNVDSAVESLIKQSVADISVEPFVLTFDQLSYWSRPKVLCLTCKQDDYTTATAPGSLPPMEVRSGDSTPRLGEAEQLPRVAHGAVALAAALDAAVASCDIQTDKRPYLPHITLARHVRHLPDINFKPIVWRAESFCLVESCSEPDGVQYKVIQQWPLIKLAV
ncbi:MAG: RNA 2',3'-cyclic phosphodiesterase [Methylobacter sp.]|jgi:2'-5' RNA ligase